MNRTVMVRVARAAAAGLFALLAPGCLVSNAYDDYCASTGRCGADAAGLDSGVTDSGSATDAGGVDSGPPTDAGVDGGGSCRVAGAACGNPGNCCSGNCVGAICVPTGCKPANFACASPSECCSNTCTNSVCVPFASCKQDLAPCGASTECCSNNCTGGSCQACHATGTSCTLNLQCCSGNCTGQVCTTAPPDCAPDAGHACSSPDGCCFAPGPNFPLGTRCDSVAGKCLGPQSTIGTTGNLCWTAGTFCLPNDPCCNGPCTAGICPPSAAACVNQGTSCQVGSDCCSSACDFSAPPKCVASSTQTPEGVSCSTRSECANGLFCADSFPPGKWRCDPAPPCSVMGASCDATACCANHVCSPTSNACCSPPGILCASNADCCPNDFGQLTCVRNICQLQFPDGTAAPVGQVTGVLQRYDGGYCTTSGKPCTNPGECCSGQCTAAWCA